MEDTEKIYFQVEKDLLSSSTKDRVEILTTFDGKILNVNPWIKNLVKSTIAKMGFAYFNP